MSQDAVIIGDEFPDLYPSCDAMGQVTDRQRNAMQAGITSLVCHLPMGHAGKVHWDNVDDAAWMRAEDWVQDPVEPMDGTTLEILAAEPPPYITITFHDMPADKVDISYTAE